MNGARHWRGVVHVARPADGSETELLLASAKDLVLKRFVRRKFRTQCRYAYTEVGSDRNTSTRGALGLSTAKKKNKHDDF